METVALMFKYVETAQAPNKMVLKRSLMYPGFLALPFIYLLG